MHWEIIFVSAMVLSALILFISEKLPVDLTSMVIFSILLSVAIISKSEKLPNVKELLGVFSNPAPLSIAAMFIMSAGLEKCGLMDTLAQVFARFTPKGYHLLLGVLLFSVGFASLFINNTAVVIVILPVVLSLARTMRTPASKFLIPLSYASIFGGCCTAIGTSTNILVSSILSANGMEPLAMFELTWIGLPLMIASILFLIAFANKLLPVRETLSSMLSEEERKEYITEAYVTEGSSLIDIPLKESPLLKTPGIKVIEVIRNSVPLENALNEIVLQKGDRLVLACRPSGMAKARHLEGINFTDKMDLGLKQIASHEGAIVEGVLGPTSSIIGKTIKEINFRQHFRMILIAVHRKGANVREKLGILRFEFGDTLLMLGTENAIENIRRNDEIILLDRPAIPANNMRKKMPLAIGILTLVVLSVTFNFLPIVAAAIMGATLTFLTGCLKLKDGYNSIEWKILILLYGMLAIGMSMEKSGFSQLAAEKMVLWAENFLSPNFRVYGLFACVYLCTTLLTEVLSNNATAVLMAPIAIGLATTLGVDPRPFVIGTAIASSASFATPIGYQTNTYVYGVGGYRFKDFLCIGLPLNFLYFLGSLYIIPRVWPF